MRGAPNARSAGFFGQADLGHTCAKAVQRLQTCFKENRNADLKRQRKRLLLRYSSNLM